MAQSRTKKKLMNIAYNIGASIVILGALFKILHWKVDIAGVIIGGGTLLAVGLIAEALIFFLSAFESVDDDLDWALVYPELAGGSQKARALDVNQAEEAQGLLSQKLDEMLKEAKLDANVMSSLSTSIMNFKGAAENIAPAIDSIAATNRYSEQLSLAAAQMESLNSLYKVQLESTSRQTDINDQFAGNAQKLQVQMESLTNNLASLNGVYGGMLTAMSSKN
ncbi:MAG: gliding motility protein GldL [Flavobacteriaceae bacterium]|nr:MAG: gliding motility protein GldL [Flavobacteriaceae bacterium]